MTERTPPLGIGGLPEQALIDLMTKPPHRDPNVCQRCNGMGGIYVPSNGGRTFVSCPECSRRIPTGVGIGGLND